MKILLCILSLMAYKYVSAASTSYSLSDDRKDVPVAPLTDPRIVGGNRVGIAMHPHQVSLRFKNKFGRKFPYSHYCGGSIYSERTIITAAHCIYKKIPSEFQVVASTKNRQGNDGYIVPVEKIIMHEKYIPNLYDNDIAILILGASLPLNNYTTRAIELAEHDDDTRAGIMATVTGWGALSSAGYYPDELQEVKVPLLSREDCSIDYPGRIRESMICAGYRGIGGMDACQGDSGGPLVANGKLIGVVSWGRGCAHPDYPGVYSKVSYLRPWIMEKLKEINDN